MDSNKCEFWTLIHHFVRSESSQRLKLMSRMTFNFRHSSHGASRFFLMCMNESHLPVTVVEPMKHGRTSYYTKHCIECHMVFYVTCADFLIKWHFVWIILQVCIVISTSFQFIQMSAVETNFFGCYHFCNEMLSWMIGNWIKRAFVCDSVNVILKGPKKLTWDDKLR